MKIWNVWFNDGGWSTGRTVYQEVASTKEEAIEKVLVDKPFYRTGYDVLCSEFTMEGYVIKVYDERSYKRDRIIDDIIK